MQTLKTRADFVRIAAGRKWATPGVVLQARESPDALRPVLEGAAVLRIGYTVTKTVGNAVIRNRVKRRLRAAAAEVMPAAGRAGHDYVLIGRKGTVDRPFPALLGDLATALRNVHGGRAQRRSGGA